jgi:putative ABC transport system permease protein
MGLLSSIRTLRDYVFRRPRVEREMEEEFRSHLESRAEDLQRLGLSRAEAERQARIEFGSYENYKEECREALGTRLLQELAADIRYGLRQLRHNPGFTIVAVLTLALGIGANTAIFSVVNAVLLQPLPYPDSGRIVNIARKGGTDTVPMFTYWQENNPGFDDLAAYADLGYAEANLTGGDRPELVQTRKVSLNYFRLFGANPILGRTFTAQEDRPGGPRVMVMSFGLWQQRFGGDASILGKEIALGGATYTVIGVLSPAFRPYPPADAWIPLQADVNSTNQAHVLMVSGRLPPGVTLAQANSWMSQIGKRYVQAYPTQLGNDDKLQVTLMQESVTGDIRPALLILLGAVGMVLLIACSNVANLLLARAMTRQREIAVRAAIGAGRGRILRQLLTESLMLACGGGALGLVLGSVGVSLLLMLAPAYLLRVPGLAPGYSIDPRVAGFTLALAFLTGILFGSVPALRFSRTDLTSFLREASTRGGVSRKQYGLRSALVTADIAIAFVLLCGAMLLIRSFAAMHNDSLGFDPHNLLTMQVSLAGSGYATSTSVDRVYRQFVERAERIPGVELASMASALPLQGRYGQDMVFDIPGRPPLKGYKFTGDVQWRIVSPHYFQTLRIPLLSGRLLQERETRRTVVINSELARKFWPGTNPVGHSIIIGGGLGPDFDEGPVEIVGVLGDVREQLGYDPPPIMYQLPSQVPDAAMALVDGLSPTAVIVRTRTGVAPMSVRQEVQRALQTNDMIAVGKVRTMDQVSLDSTARQNFNAVLLGILASVALLLSAVGIYGVISYSVVQRTHEIGIRMAVGARKHDVFALVVGQGLKITLIGVGIGLAGAVGLTRSVSSLLYGVKPTDPLTFIAVSLILIAVALLACYIPARRAAKVDPMEALRYE